MRYLLISIAALFFVSCASYPKRNRFQPSEPSLTHISNPFFSDSQKDYIYKADLSIYKKRLSGILIIKKLGEAEHRVVFTTEMGNKIFDFTLFGDNFKINYILDEIDKKLIINILKSDFRALTSEKHLIAKAFRFNLQTVFETKIENSEYYYFFDTDAMLSRMVRSKNGKEKVAFEFTEIDKTNATRIEILHKNIKLSIVLKAI